MPVSMETKKSQQRFTKEFKIEAVKQVTGKRYRGQTPYISEPIYRSHRQASRTDHDDAHPRSRLATAQHAEAGCA